MMQRTARMRYGCSTSMAMSKAARSACMLVATALAAALVAVWLESEHPAETLDILHTALSSVTSSPISTFYYAARLDAPAYTAVATYAAAPSAVPCLLWQSRQHVMDRRVGIFSARHAAGTNALECGICPTGFTAIASHRDCVADCSAGSIALECATPITFASVGNNCTICDACEITLEPHSKANCSCTDGNWAETLAIIAPVARGVSCICNTSYYAAVRCRDQYTPVAFLSL